MGQQGKPQIFFNRRLCAGQGGPQISAAIFSCRPGQDIDGSINSRAQDQVIIQRSAQVQDQHQQRHIDDGIQPSHDGIPLGLGKHIGYHGGKAHTQQHKVQRRHGQYPLIQVHAKGSRQDQRPCQQAGPKPGALYPAEEQSAEPAKQHTQGHRQKHHHQHRPNGKALGGNMGGSKCHHRKEHQGCHQVIQHSHGDQRAGDRPGGFHLVHDGQGRRRCSGQGNAPKQKRQINRHLGQGEDHPEYQADYHKGP